MWHTWLVFAVSIVFSCLRSVAHQRIVHSSHLFFELPGVVVGSGNEFSLMSSIGRVSFSLPSVVSVLWTYIEGEHAATDFTKVCIREIRAPTHGGAKTVETVSCHDVHIHIRLLNLLSSSTSAHTTILRLDPRTAVFHIQKVGKLVRLVHSTLTTTLVNMVVDH